jgi:hypothetical protein
VHEGRVIVQTQLTLAYYCFRAKFYELTPIIGSMRNKEYVWYYKDDIRTPHVGNEQRVQLVVVGLVL